MATFNSYTMPAEATEFDEATHFASKGNLTTQRNNWTVDWTRRKWYRIGYLWNAAYSDIEEHGMWVGDLDDLTSFTWMPFVTTSFDPDSHVDFHSYVGLVAFEGTKYLAVAAAYDSTLTRIDHLLIDSETGAFVASATASNADTAANVDNSPFLLPTTDSNVWHRFDVSDENSTGTTKWAVIKYDISAETVTVLVDYATAPAGLQDIEDKNKCKGQEGSTYNTVFVYHPDADDGRIFEVTIPHNTTSDADLSFETFKTVAVPSGHAVVGVYYELSSSKLVYSYRKRLGGAAPWAIKYEAVTRTAPSTVLWSEEVVGDAQTFSGLHDSSYHHYRITGCTCIDFLENNVIDISTGTITKLDVLTEHSSVQGTRFHILDMETNSVWSAFQETKPVTDTNFVTNDFSWPAMTSGNEPFITFVQAYQADLNTLYPSGACGITGISFGEEKDPNYLDFATIA